MIYALQSKKDICLVVSKIMCKQIQEKKTKKYIQNKLWYYDRVQNKPIKNHLKMQQSQNKKPVSFFCMVSGGDQLI